MKPPICECCPNCGCREFLTVRPEGFLAFSSDRLCKACETRYSPPTPLWAAITFIVVGVVLCLGCAASIALALVRGLTSALPTNIVFLIVGVLSIRQGILSRYETVLPAPQAAVPEAKADSWSLQQWTRKNLIGLGFGVLVIIVGLALFFVVQKTNQEMANQRAKNAAAIRDLERLGGEYQTWMDGEVRDISVQRASERTQMFQGQALGNREITDDDLRIVGRFPRLERLRINSTEITDAGIAKVSPRPELLGLTIQCPLVTDQGLSVVARLNRLDHLDLSTTQVHQLSGLRLDLKPDLQYLILSETAIDNESLSAVASLKSLKKLDLRRTKIDDNAMKYLVDLSNLQELRLEGTGVTKEGVRQLQFASELLILGFGTANDPENIDQ